MPKRELVDIAAAYRFSDGDKVVWLPKAQSEWDVDTKTMTMPEWRAKEKGLI